MPYLRRKADFFLQEWKRNPDRNPLLVKGARQVGKTETILHFARENYENVLEINFVDKPIFKSITRDGYEPGDIIRLMTQFDETLHPVPGKTLIFFDEVQAHPDIMTSLKFFKKDGRFDVIASGSLLGIQYGRITSLSVGYQENYEMHGLDFEEFLWALGHDERISDELLGHMVEKRPFNDGQMQRFERLFSDYTVLGGMPAVISEFLKMRTFDRTWKVQKNILALYREYVGKYAEKLDRAKILAVFDSITPQLSRENKKFQYSKVERSARARDYGACVEWLVDAGIASQCFALSVPEVPLEGNYDSSKFKLYLADTGLLIATMDEFTREDVRANRSMGIYKGAVYENLAAEALVKQGFGLYYYKRENAQLEEDFFVRSRDGILPIEVKAGNNAARSLRELVENPRYSAIHRGFKFARANVGSVNGVTTYPLFTLFLLNRLLHSESKCS